MDDPDHPPCFAVVSGDGVWGIQQWRDYAAHLKGRLDGLEADWAAIRARLADTEVERRDRCLMAALSHGRPGEPISDTIARARQFEEYIGGLAGRPATPLEPAQTQWAEATPDEPVSRDPEPTLYALAQKHGLRPPHDNDPIPEYLRNCLAAMMAELGLLK
jgi:hypothetical protein